MGMILYLHRVTPAELEQLHTDPGLLFRLEESERCVDGTPRTVDLDQAWDGIRFVLSGADLGRAVLSTALLDPGTDNGYGPAHWLAPADVTTLATALSSYDFTARADADALAGADLYPGFEGEPEDLDYLAQHFGTMRDLFARAAAAGDAVVQQVS